MQRGIFMGGVILGDVVRTTVWVHIDYPFNPLDGRHGLSSCDCM